MKILVIEDEPGLQKVLKKALKYECFSVDIAEDGKRGSFLGCSLEYDAIILDNMLPILSGKEVCERIRNSGKKTPILVLSAISFTDKKIEMLDAGADDYMVKPFSIDELVARLRAIIRRPDEVYEDILCFKDLIVNIKKHSVSIKGESVQLTKKEMMLLEYFMRNTGVVLSRGSLIEHVWDMYVDPFSNTIESHILSLRKKLGDQKNNNYIKTIPGRGYKME